MQQAKTIINITIYLKCGSIITTDTYPESIPKDLFVQYKKFLEKGVQTVWSFGLQKNPNQSGSEQEYLYLSFADVALMQTREEVIKIAQT